MNLIKKSLFFCFIIFFSILLLFILIEGCLRVSGFAYLKVQQYHNQQKLGDSKDIRILCIGESTTALGGNDSYPSQLEKALQKKYPDKSIVVINKGMPGKGGDTIIKNFPRWLNEFQPNIVIAMVGINGQRRRIPLKEMYYEKSFLNNFQTAKLFAWITSAVKTKWTSNKHSNMKDENKKEEEKFYKLTENDLRLLIVAEQYLIKREYAKAEKILLYLFNLNTEQHERFVFKKKLISLYKELRNATRIADVFERDYFNPYDHFVSANIIQSCQFEKSQEIIDFLNRKIEKHPQEAGYYSLMAQCEKERGNLTLYNKFSLKYDEIYRQTLDKPMADDYLKLIHATKGKNLLFVVMQYPMRSIDALKNYISANINNRNILFIENQEMFQKMLVDEGYDVLFTDHFAGDFGHATALGNKLISENIVESLKEYIQ